MARDRSIERVVGVLFIVATAASIGGSAALGSVTEQQDYLITIGSHEGQVLSAALLFLIAALAAFATAFLLFPILRRYSEGLAAGYVGLRAFENVFYVASVVALLVMVTVSQDNAATSAGAATLMSLGAVLLAMRDWSVLLGTLLFAGLGAVLLNSVLYRWRLVPRWLSLWGLIGAVMILVYGLLGFSGFDTSLGSPFMALAMPIAVQEMVFAGWLLAKGLEPHVVVHDRAPQRRVGAVV
jgi:hypothetical protein